jgi:hypothetical protein
MEPQWFYLAAGQQRGPVTLEELVRALAAAPGSHGTPVWHAAMADWQPAGSVPELRATLPPPQPSRLAVVENAETMARLYRRLVLLVGVQILAGILQLPLSATRAPGTSLLALLFSLVVMGVLVATGVTAYQLTRSMGSRAPLAWAIAMFLPCVNIIVLLVLSSQAQGWCRRYGIKVGLLGPTRESIEELRRRLMTSHFD